MAYLFDLDGTLIDSESAHKAAEVETFAELGYNFTVADLYRFTGVPYRAMIAEIAPELSIEDFFEVHKPRLLGCIGTMILPFDDVDACLFELSRHQAAIVTSSPSWYVDAVRSSFGVFGSVFDAVVSGDDVKIGKPDPEPFVLGASRLGADPGNCIAIEDSPNGIASAKAAGCYTIAVRRDAALDLSRADRIVGSLAELRDVA
jgi:sugar-phosphatase